MRKGYDNGILVTEETVQKQDDVSAFLVGINLGADFVSEHEWGINGLKVGFGIPAKPSRELYGIDARTVQKIPPDLYFLESGGDSYLVYRQWLLSDHVGYEGPPNSQRLNVMLKVHDESDGLSTAWSSDDFGIRCKGDTKRVLKRMFDAFTQKDIVFFLGGSGAFQNAGLKILIRSKVPDAFASELAQADLDRLDVTDAFKKTNIEDILKKAKKEYFALSPHWADEEKRTLKFWLNPFEQDKYHSGWVTLEDLMLWTEDKGKILKNKS